MLPLFRYAILDSDGEPQECDMQTWMPWFIEHADPDRRRVALDQVGDYEISTVFVGCGLTYFETEVFNDLDNGVWERRGDTREEALAAHAAAKAWGDGAHGGRSPTRIGL